MSNLFISKSEKELAEKYLKNGYVITDIKNISSLEWIRKFYLTIINKNLKKKLSDEKAFDQFHRFIRIKELNNFRLNLIQSINKKNDFKRHFFNIASPFVEQIVGNELVMQNRINLSIQLPNDSSSLLDVHADTWSGDSSFETVVWLPLVDCYRTKSMYILPASKYYIIENLLKSPKIKNNADLFPKIKKDIKWLKVNFGQVLIFNQCLPHGNLVNQVNETRWSMNCRFKGIFTPYGDKKLGEFFEPITLKPASKFAMKYKLPKI